MLSGGATHKRYSIASDSILAVVPEGPVVKGKWPKSTVVIAVHNFDIIKAVALPSRGGVQDATHEQLAYGKPQLGRGFYIEPPQKAAIAQLHAGGWRVMCGENPPLPENLPPDVLADNKRDPYAYVRLRDRGPTKRPTKNQRKVVSQKASGLVPVE